MSTTGQSSREDTLSVNDIGTPACGANARRYVVKDYNSSLARRSPLKSATFKGGDAVGALVLMRNSSDYGGRLGSHQEEGDLIDAIHGVLRPA